MKRYDFDKNTHVFRPTDGEFVSFADAQADKHAALKELATKSLNYGHWHHLGCGINKYPLGRTIEIRTNDETACTCGLREFNAQLISLKSGPV